MTLECGILDNEAKMNRKRKLVDRKNLFEEGNQDSEDLKAALETIGERTEYMKVGLSGIETAKISKPRSSPSQKGHSS